jgi:hypothetical protein
MTKDRAKTEETVPWFMPPRSVVTIRQLQEAGLNEGELMALLNYYVHVHDTQQNATHKDY